MIGHPRTSLVVQDLSFCDLAFQEVDVDVSEREHLRNSGAGVGIVVRLGTHPKHDVFVDEYGEQTSIDVREVLRGLQKHGVEPIGFFHPSRVLVREVESDRKGNVLENLLNDLDRLRHTRLAKGLLERLAVLVDLRRYAQFAPRFDVIRDDGGIVVSEQLECENSPVARLQCRDLVVYVWIERHPGTLIGSKGFIGHTEVRLVRAGGRVPEPQEEGADEALLRCIPMGKESSIRTVHVNLVRLNADMRRYEARLPRLLDELYDVLGHLEVLRSDLTSVADLRVDLRLLLFDVSEARHGGLRVPVGQLGLDVVDLAVEGTPGIGDLQLQVFPEVARRVVSPETRANLLDLLDQELCCASASRAVTIHTMNSLLACASPGLQLVQDQRTDSPSRVRDRVTSTPHDDASR